MKTASGATAVQIVHSNGVVPARLSTSGRALAGGGGGVEGGGPAAAARAPRTPSTSVTGGPEGQALPITSTQSKHLWDALGWAYDRLGLDVATGAMRCFVSWYWPGWLSRPEARLDVRLHATGKPVISRCRSDPAKLRHELATAICENWHLAAYRTSSTRRLHCGSYRGAAVTSRRGRGEDSVYLDGDRWRGAASLGYGPDRRLTVAGFLDRWLTQVFRGK